MGTLTTKSIIYLLLVIQQVLNGNANGKSSFFNFKKTSWDLSLSSRTNQTFLQGRSSLTSCANHCSKDIHCFGFGVRGAKYDCLLIKVTEPYGTLQIPFENFIFYKKELLQSCDDVVSGRSGPYMLQFPETNPAVVWCDMDTPQGPWLVFQRRIDGREEFYRNWEDYKWGFGSGTGEYWLGNENLHQLTMTASCKLRVELTDKDGVIAAAKYNIFKIGSAVTKYALTVKDYDNSIPPGDSLAYHDGAFFSTFDEDNDLNTTGSCAVTFHGAWWYTDCHSSNLNGIYGSDEYGMGVIWYPWRGHYYSLTSSMMMIKCN